MIDNLDYKGSNKLISDYYNMNTLETTKMFTVILFSFIYGYSFYKDVDCYRSFILVNNISRTKYMISKSFVLFLISFVFVLLIVFAHYLIPMFYKVYINIKKIYIFINIIVLINYYGLLSIFLIQVTDNIYICLLPIFIYILINSIVLNISNDLIKILGYFVLTIINFEIIHSIYYGLLILLMLIFINVLVFNYRDLQN